MNESDLCPNLCSALIIDPIDVSTVTPVLALPDMRTYAFQIVVSRLHLRFRWKVTSLSRATQLAARHKSLMSQIDWRAMIKIRASYGDISPAILAHNFSPTGR